MSFAMPACSSVFAGRAAIRRALVEGLRRRRRKWLPHDARTVLKIQIEVKYRPRGSASA
jgi:hypothetical protein